MENTSKENLQYQYGIILKDVRQGVSQDEIDCDDLIEKLNGIKEIQIALKTLTN